MPRTAGFAAPSAAAVRTPKGPAPRATATAAGAAMSAAVAIVLFAFSSFIGNEHTPQTSSPRRADRDSVHAACRQMVNLMGISGPRGLGARAPATNVTLHDAKSLNGLGILVFGDDCVRPAPHGAASFRSMLEQTDRGGRGQWFAVASAVVLLEVLALGCGSPPSKSEPAELLSAGEAEAITARWQGAWVMPFRSGDPSTTSRIGTHEVWAVEGTWLTRWGGDTEEVGAMTLLARCLVKVGDRRFSYHAFAFSEGRLIVDHRIGVRDGDAITVCSDLGGVYTFDGTTCRYWERPIIGRGGLASHPATCAADGARFDATSADDVTAPHAMRIDGDLVRQDLEHVGGPATRFDTLASAKASLLE